MRANRPMNDDWKYRGKYRGAALALWMLAAGSALFWAQKILHATPSPSPAPAQPRSATSAREMATANTAALTQLLGGTGPAQIEHTTTRFTLTGTVVGYSTLTAGRHGADGADGLALIAVDARQARHYRVGQPVDELYMLQSVDAGSATLAPRNGTQAPLTIALPRPLPGLARADRMPPAVENAPLEVPLRERPPLSMRFQSPPVNPPANPPVTP